MVESIMIKDINTNQELNMDKFNTPDYILDYVDWGQATVNYNTSQYVNQIGVTVISASYKSRNIDISGFIVAESESEMTDRKNILNGFFVPMHEYVLKYKEYQIKVRINSSVRYTNTDETSNNECVCRFKISGICPYPLFFLFEDIQVNVGKYVSSFHFPFSVSEDKPIVLGVQGTGDFRKRIIRNTGQIPIGFKFTMEADGGSVVNPTLYNFTSDENNSIKHFTIVKTLQDREVVEVNTNAGSKSVIGRIGSGTPSNYFQYMSSDSSWLMLRPGDNLIGYYASSGIDFLKITMEISPRFVEVQECF